MLELFLWIVSIFLILAFIGFSAIFFGSICGAAIMAFSHIFLSAFFDYHDHDIPVFLGSCYGLYIFITVLEERYRGDSYWARNREWFE